MKKILFLFSFIFCIQIICGKNIHPVTPDGVKIIDVTAGAFHKQIDKNEKPLIKTLNFIGFTQFPLKFEKKDMDLILDLPNLTTIELAERPTNYIDYNIILDEVPNIETVILNSYNKNGEKIYAPNPIAFFDIEDGKDMHNRIEYLLKYFPNLNTFIQNYGVPEDFANLNQHEYAIYLDKKLFTESPYQQGQIGTWSAHALPSKGYLVFEKNKKSDFSTELTVIPSRTKIDDIIKDLSFTNIDQYNFGIPSNFIYIGNVEGSQYFNIMESDNNLFLVNFYTKDKNFEVNRPLVILGGRFEHWPDIEKLSFNKPVWILGTIHNGDSYVYLNKLVFNDNVTLPLTSLENIPNIEFKKIPTVYGNEKINFNKTVIDIPDGTINEFIALGFPKENINAITSQPITITVKEPNTILSYISPDKLKEVEDLTVIGFLYDTDIKILSECTNLKKLDLSRCIITVSPQTQKDRQQEAEAMSAIFGMINQKAQQKYQDWEISRESAEHASILSALADMDLKNVNKNIEDCYVPGGAFKDLKFLKSVKLPLTASYIGTNAFSNCTALTEVELPPYLKNVYIGAFDNSGIVNIKLPASVESLSDYRNDRCAFGNCPNLEILDASEAQITVWQDPLYNCKKLILPNVTKKIKYLRLPKGSEIYLPASVIEFTRDDHYNNLIIHAAGTEAPAGYLNDCTIYVPKGGMTSWYAKFGKNNKIIEE